jgi:hypothetical protein
VRIACGRKYPRRHCEYSEAECGNPENSPSILFFTTNRYASLGVIHIELLRSFLTSFPPNFLNKTTSANELPQTPNLITSLKMENK